MLRHIISSSNQKTKTWLNLVTMRLEFVGYMRSYLLKCYFPQDNLEEQEVSEQDSDQEAQNYHASIPTVSLREIAPTRLVVYYSRTTYREIRYLLSRSTPQ